MLFFKVGKFYELYEDDAEIGCRELDWKMTVSGVGHCRQVGCPESGVDAACARLVALGHKVGRIEQLETAAQAKARTGSKTAVIARGNCRGGDAGRRDVDGDLVGGDGEDRRRTPRTSSRSPRRKTRKFSTTKRRAKRRARLAGRKRMRSEEPGRERWGTRF